ncbi:hypothetical protein QTP70_023205 [Hemibagrus guttatus]|uniref:Uncharacterized protein n=1 Tax=Hemibagrus guttatus TaxID=175788 RepID=A0AAE0R533_9TELE|nr:hypothetical protein QTP70_023205 [Hemibagrus guttatus]
MPRNLIIRNSIYIWLNSRCYHWLSYLLYDVIFFLQCTGAVVAQGLRYWAPGLLL